MPLSPRERILYKDSCDVFRPQRRIDTHAKPGDVSYTKVATGLACFFEINTSLGSPELFGRAETDRVYTFDTVFFDKVQDIQADDVLVCKSLDRDGTQVQNYGKPWAVRGIPQRVWDSGRRRGGLAAVYASQMLKLPDGVTP